MGKGSPSRAPSTGNSPTKASPWGGDPLPMPDYGGPNPWGLPKSPIDTRTYTNTTPALAPTNTAPSPAVDVFKTNPAPAAPPAPASPTLAKVLAEPTTPLRPSTNSAPYSLSGGPGVHQTIDVELPARYLALRARAGYRPK